MTRITYDEWVKNNEDYILTAYIESIDNIYEVPEDYVKMLYEVNNEEN